MQTVRLDILKSSSNPRCSRLYDRLLANQSQWSRIYPPAVEHACATTVVEANPPEPATQSTSFESTRFRPSKTNPYHHHGNLYWKPVSRTQTIGCPRSMVGMDRFRLLLAPPHPWFGWRRTSVQLKGYHQHIANTRQFASMGTKQRALHVRSVAGPQPFATFWTRAAWRALHPGRYTWRHDSVLQVLQRHLTSFWKHVERESSQVNAPFIRIVKEGAHRLPNKRRNTRPLLSDDVLRCARDWQFLFDVGTGYSIFPIDIAVTRQRPDFVFFSQSLRVVILIELTVLLEDRIAAASTCKKNCSLLRPASHLRKQWLACNPLPRWSWVSRLGCALLTHLLAKTRFLTVGLKRIQILTNPSPNRVIETNTGYPRILLDI